MSVNSQQGRKTNLNWNQKKSLKEISLKPKEYSRNTKSVGRRITNEYFDF